MQVEGAGYDAELRKGDFGLHTTKVGKIVYARVKRRFTRRDFERIGKKLYHLQRSEPDENEPSWWFTLMQDITISMLSDILEAIPALDRMELNAEEVYFNIYRAGQRQLAVWVNELRKRGYGNIANAIEQFDKLGTGRK